MDNNNDTISMMLNLVSTVASSAGPLLNRLQNAEGFGFTEEQKKAAIEEIKKSGVDVKGNEALEKLVSEFKSFQDQLKSRSDAAAN